MVTGRNTFLSMLSLLVLFGAQRAVAEASAAPVRTERANALILFGANWCAPCLAELRELPTLAKAMAPGRIVIVWQDGPPRRLWPAWPDNAVMGDADDVAMTPHDNEGAGLPYAIMLDEAGNRCLLWKGKVTPERLARMRAQCSKGG